jgi:hypothetical protein
VLFIYLFMIGRANSSYFHEAFDFVSIVNCPSSGVRESARDEVRLRASDDSPLRDKGCQAERSARETDARAGA